MKFKVVFRIITVFMICLTVFEIVSTYAIFESQITGKASANIGKWNIEINSTDVTSNDTKEFNITNLDVINDENVLDGKAAPGCVGSFNFTINPMDTDVAIRYDILIDQSYLNNDSITLESVTEIIDDELELVKTGEATYTGIIPLNKINGNYYNEISVKFKWENNDKNNESDTAIGETKNNTLNIPISVKFSQYMGEEIVEYSI